MEGPEAVAALSELYATVRLFVNFFQPSFKLAGKTRDGARVRKRYHPPATPCQRLLADPRTPQGVRDEANALFATLDPVRLLRDMRRSQQRLVEIADRPVTAQSTPASIPSIDEFLAGLRTAWQGGEVRPMAKPAEKPKRGRRRPDPLVDVTDQLQEWFEAEPWHTSRELLERLQEEHPGRYPDNLLRTLQRRVQIWRQNKACDLVFGSSQSDDEITEPLDGTDPAKASVRQLNPIPNVAMDPGVGNRLAAARLMTVAAASLLPTPPAGSRNRHVGRSRNAGEH